MDQGIDPIEEEDQQFDEDDAEENITNYNKRLNMLEGKGNQSTHNQEQLAKEIEKLRVTDVAKPFQDYKINCNLSKLGYCFSVNHKA